MLGQPVALMRMFLCQTCGNKRCPGADDHRLPCSGSNEPGQRWSAYADDHATRIAAGGLAVAAMTYRDAVAAARRSPTDATFTAVEAAMRALLSTAETLPAGAD